MSVYPWNKITTTASPFVQVFSGIGVIGAAGILNFVVLTAAISATNSCLFSTSRTMYALSMGGNASSFLNRLGRNGVPNIALNFSTAFFVNNCCSKLFYPRGGLQPGFKCLNHQFCHCLDCFIDRPFKVSKSQSQGS